MSLKFFIPGGAGYIGSVLVEKILKLNHQVCVLDNFFYNQKSLLHLVHYNNLEIISGDVRDLNLVKNCVTKADVIIPLAALVGAPICNRLPELSKEINLDSSLKLFDFVSNRQMLLMPTTNSAYGSGNAENYCDEKSPLNPVSTYAIMKLELEKRLLEKAGAISFRLATVFGISTRMRLDLLVNDFTFRALKYQKISIFEGHYKRNYIHINDVANAFLHSIENFDKMSGQIYNVGLSTANISKLDLCKIIKKKIEPFDFIEDKVGKDPDQRNYIVSNKKIETTGFTTRHTLENGIDEIIKAYPLLDENLMKNC